MNFYLGVHRANWLWDERFTGVPLFVSNNTLRSRKSAFPRAVTSWALDSGAFSELKQHGRWTISAQEYVEDVQRYKKELGSMVWASPQDWMCEPPICAKTGLSVRAHQWRTIASYLLLDYLLPDTFIPVLQGWEVDDYLDCINLYGQAGVDLTSFDTVGVGSVCKRQHTEEIHKVFQLVDDAGINAHGYGVKVQGLDRYAPLLTSADSLAWSYHARYAKVLLPGHDQPGGDRTRGHKNCANCAEYALKWRNQIASRS